MKKIFIILFVILYAAGAYCADYDFRKTKWGMSKNEVVKSESTKAYYSSLSINKFNENDRGSYIYFYVKAAGINMIVHYYFTNDIVGKLYRTSYQAGQKSWTIKDYTEIKQKLIYKYGAVTEEINWLNDSIKERYQYKTFDAVRFGYLTKYCDWITDRSKIHLMLEEGKNFTALCWIVYLSKDIEYIPLKLQIPNAQDMSNF